MFKRCGALAVLFVTMTLQGANKADRSGTWPEYGGDLAGQRFSTATQLTPANMKDVAVAWRFHTHVFDIPSKFSNGRASFEATPVLWNGALYFDSPFDTIFAVDAATGAMRWSFDPKIDREDEIYIVTSRGVTLWHAKHPGKAPCATARVFVATLDRRLIARDAITGEECSQFGRHGSVDLSAGVDLSWDRLYGFTSPVTVVNDTIVVGSSVADNQRIFTASGAVRGFSAITGQQLWSWEPLPWAMRQNPKKSGSANAWSVISADPEHDLVFVPTGSASVDYFGGEKPGDNRDADSIVALQASTGRRVWGFQFVHHDLWDYDTPSEPLLFDFHGKIPAVAVTTKTNMVFVFNRLTGEPLFPIEERAVPGSTIEGERAWPTQPFSSLPPLAPLTYQPSDLHFRDQQDRDYCQEKLRTLEYKGLFTPPSRRGALVYPGSLGGSNWGSSALDPATNTLYTRVSSLPFVVQQIAKHTWPLEDHRRVRLLHEWYLKHAPEWLGGDPPAIDVTYRAPDSGGEERDDSPQHGVPFRLSRSGLLSPRGLPCAPEPFGSLVAINLDTGQKLWSVPHGVMAPNAEGSIGAGGPIVTKGGLVFAASTNDPYLRAYASMTGKEVWRHALPVPANATPMTYELKGRQYVVIAAGGHGFLGKGHGDEVIAFALPNQPASTRVKTKQRPLR